MEPDLSTTSREMVKKVVDSFQTWVGERDQAEGQEWRREATPLLVAKIMGWLSAQVGGGVLWVGGRARKWLE